MPIQRRHAAKLVDGMAILHWLADHGVPGPLAAQRQQEAEQKAARDAWNRWATATPTALRELPIEVLRDVFSRRDLTPVLAALAAAYTDARAVHLAVLHWFGSGAGPWTGHPEYELFAEQILRAFGCDAVIASLCEADPDDRQLEGAARFLAHSSLPTSFPSAPIPTGMNVFVPEVTAEVALPVGLHARLARHCEASPDPDVRKRAQVLVAAGTRGTRGV